MNIERLNINGTDIAVISSDGQVISGTQSALDLAMTVKYEAGTGNITEYLEQEVLEELSEEYEEISDAGCSPEGEERGDEE